MQQVMGGTPAASSADEAGDDGGADEAIGMDMLRFTIDMPLVSALHFQEHMLPTTPEAMVDDLLAQLHQA